MGGAGTAGAIVDGLLSVHLSGFLLLRNYSYQETVAGIKIQVVTTGIFTSMQQEMQKRSILQEYFFKNLPTSRVAISVKLCNIKNNSTCCLQPFIKSKIGFWFEIQFLPRTLVFLFETPASGSIYSPVISSVNNDFKIDFLC